MHATPWRAAAGLLLAVTSTLAAGPARASAPQYCDEGRPAPCLVSVLRDGIAVDRVAYSATVDTYTPPEDAHNTGFTLDKGGMYGLGSGELGHVFTVTMDTGTIKPRIVSGWGSNGSAERIDDGDGTWQVRVTLQPADMLMTCAGVPVTCPSVAPPDTNIQYAQAHVDDGTWYADGGGDPEDLTGLDVFSNINLLWYPPAITVDSAGAVTMDVAMQNSHYYADGSTVFYGHANLRLPYHVLRDLYGIPNPETMTPGSFVSTSTSGTVASGPTPTGGAWDIVLDGMTFSKQHLRLKRGTIVPTRPTSVSAKRVSSRQGRVFGTSTPRGAKVTGYAVRCVSGAHIVRGSAPASPVLITGLRAGRAYSCGIRARSKVGFSPARAVTLAARP